MRWKFEGAGASSRSMRDWSFLACAMLLLAWAPPLRAGLTPESPEVKASVERAVKYLLNTPVPTVGERDEPWMQPSGREALVGLALLKAQVPPDNPRVVSAAKMVLQMLNNGRIDRGYEAVYNCSAAIIFLSALDPDRYRGDIQKLLGKMLKFQLPHGGFDAEKGHKPYGDTSMTQYAALALWEARAAGVEVPDKVWEGMCNWFIRTQFPDGGFVYTPAAPGTAQFLQPTPSMTVGAAGSLYIVGCLLTVGGPGDNPQPTQENKLPPALQPLKDSAQGQRERKRKVQINVDQNAMRNAMSRADGWINANFTVDYATWQNYYLYGMERYYSFREHYLRQVEEEPDWYDKGARFLFSKQNAYTGQFLGSYNHAEVDTAWGVLFLVRSAQKSLKKEDAASGQLIGGRGLPKGNVALVLKGGKIAAKPLSGPAEELLAIMGDPNDARFESAVEGFGEFLVSADDAMLSPLLVQLRKIAGQGPPEARAAALTALGKTRNLDHVPLLILALEDADLRVVAAARDALRFISRRFDETGPPLNNDKAQRAQGIEEWKAWYKSVRPDAALDEALK